MIGRAVKCALIVLAAPALSAAGDNDSVDLPLSQLPAKVQLFGKPITGLSVGTVVGADSHSADSYMPAKGDDPYYFTIPSERPASKAPGFLLRIPLGNDGGR